MNPQLQKISTFLWFDNQAEEAVRFYTGIFPNSSVGPIVRYGDTGPGPAGSVMTIGFELAGQQFTALNGGPIFKFTEAISLVVRCDDQDEVDYYWEKLSSGGHEECGWLKDKYGLSWQIVPKVFIEMIQDPARSQAVMGAMMKMKKLDIAELERAYREG
jgi:predicted 3-demethylubiquinone-9 3-methyltransferase (glyoxalase superfamily)